MDARGELERSGSMNHWLPGTGEAGAAAGEEEELPRDRRLQK
jgi:hypothetical protein